MPRTAQATARVAARALGAVLVALAAGACGSSAATTSPLVADLRGGGHVLVLRHTATGAGVDTTDDPADCGKQRNLSAAGRADAEAIAQAIERLGIPVGEVRASPLCRTMETARLAFGEAEPDERLLQTADPAGLRALLDDPPADGNRVLVGHQASFLEAIGIDLEEGEMAVFAPSGDLVARLAPADWVALLEEE